VKSEKQKPRKTFEPKNNKKSHGRSFDSNKKKIIEIVGIQDKKGEGELLESSKMD
jgi:hypothetical protein